MVCLEETFIDVLDSAVVSFIKGKNYTRVLYICFASVYYRNLEIGFQLIQVSFFVFRVLWLLIKALTIAIYNTPSLSLRWYWTFFMLHEVFQTKNPKYDIWFNRVKCARQFLKHIYHSSNLQRWTQLITILIFGSCSLDTSKNSQECI